MPSDCYGAHTSNRPSHVFPPAACSMPINLKKRRSTFEKVFTKKSSVSLETGMFCSAFDRSHTQ
ncbi:hypothetical protein PGTUg99_017665 [Puccinia graminis f. sp. tritici]|uniref:Uncharacterized protein n=1 Tax=Puccinia graminis f. sp. tritici TaxID=56615 RepID=A0A5B0PCK2_PUCGR|nr:hypothetical protein PGTUg99_017665 [Puccinia graminis f. sp. tritici]